MCKSRAKTNRSWLVKLQETEDIFVDKLSNLEGEKVRIKADLTQLVSTLAPLGVFGSIGEEGQQVPDLPSGSGGSGDTDGSDGSGEGGSRAREIQTYSAHPHGLFLPSPPARSDSSVSVGASALFQFPAHSAYNTSTTTSGLLSQQPELRSPALHSTTTGAAQHVEQLASFIERRVLYNHVTAISSTSPSGEGASFLQTQFSGEFADSILAAYQAEDKVGKGAAARQQWLWQHVRGHVIAYLAGLGIPATL